MKIALFFLLSLYAQAATYYVATTGSSGNLGTIGSPWDRASISAVGNPKSLNCSDVIELRGGTYDGPVRWYGSYACSPSTRVIFQNYCGEDVIFDNSTFASLSGSSPSADVTFDVTSSYIWFRKNPCGTGSFRIVNSNVKTDFSPAEWLSCYPSCRPPAFEDLGDYTRLSGLWVINTGQGIASQGSACGSEYIENIFSNVGWQSSTFTPSPLDAGEAMYAQNVDPASCSSRKIIRQNITFGSFDFGNQLQGSSGSYVDRIDIDKNVFFQMARLAADSEGASLLIGGIGTAVVDDIHVTDNIFGNYTVGFTRNSTLRFYNRFLTNGVINNNYIATLASGAGYALSLTSTLTGLSETGNRFVGPTQDGSAAGQFPNSTFVASETTDIVTERWGVLHPEVGYLTIVNGTGSATVNYTPTCSNGTVALYEMMDYLTGSIQQTFNCDSSPHAVTMAYAGSVMQPTNSSNPLTHTGSGFRVFRLVYTAASGGLYRTSGNIRSQGAIRIQ